MRRMLKLDASHDVVTKAAIHVFLVLPPVFPHRRGLKTQTVHGSCGAEWTGQCVLEMSRVVVVVGGILMSNGPVYLTVVLCLTACTFCFVFSSQGGEVQKWKPLTQSPEPQRYKLPHRPLTLRFELQRPLFPSSSFS